MLQTKTLKQARNTKRILCIWFPNWPIQRQIAVRPELRRQVVLLTRHDRRCGLVVYSCCHAAHAVGVVPGMPLPEATALAEKATQINTRSVCLLSSDPHGDHQALVALAQACEIFTPVVGVEHEAMPSSLLLDVTRTAERLGGEREVLVRVKQLFEQREYTIRVALANTIAVAWAVSHFGPQGHFGPQERRILYDGSPKPSTVGLQGCFGPHGEDDQPFVHGGQLGNTGAAASLEKPVESAIEFPLQGAAWVAPGSEWAALDPLPVESLRLEESVCRQLSHLGITRVGMLRELPRSGLSSRFGRDLLLRLDQAAGNLEETFEGEKRDVLPMARQDLEPPITDRHRVQQIAGQLVDQVACQLTRQRQAVVQLECQLQGSEGLSTTLHVGLFQPSADPELLKQLVEWQLENHSVGFAVHSLRVEAILTVVEQQRQPMLLENHRPEISRDLSLFINRLDSRLGHLATVQTRLLPRQQPEDAFQEIPLTGQVPAGRRRRSSDTIASGARPLRIINPPCPLPCKGHDSQNKLTSFDYRDQHHPIVYRWGPERIETRWWQGVYIRRDYYRIEDQQGARFWLFRRLQDGQWFLAGEFI